MKNVLATATCLLTAFTFAGCSSDSSNESNTPDSNTSMPAPGSNPSNGPQASTQYNGNYLVSCLVTPVDEPYTVEYVIQDNAAEVFYTEYADDQCVTPANTSTSSYSIVFPGGTTQTPQGIADHVDITLESRIVNGQNVVQGINEPEYTIVLINGTSLFLGDYDNINDGTSADKRAVALDLIEEAIRQ